MMSMSSNLVNSVLASTETVIDATGRDRYGRPVDYKIVNNEIRRAVSEGVKNITLMGVMGQRYIATAVDKKISISINGTPGNNLGAFMDGPFIEVFGNAQDMTGNTMSSGEIIVHGNAWDVTGLSMRGGKIFVKGNTGTRVGIHMKEFGQMSPHIVIGGRTGDYLGEYMAGGVILVLGENIPKQVSPVGLSVGSGMHGGRIFIRGKVDSHQLGVGAKLENVNDDDLKLIDELLKEYESWFGPSSSEDDFVKVVPFSSRPFRGHFDSTSI